MTMRISYIYLLYLICNGLRRGQAAVDDGATGAEVSRPLSSLTDQADDDDDEDTVMMRKKNAMMTRIY